MEKQSAVFIVIIITRASTVLKRGELESGCLLLANRINWLSYCLMYAHFPSTSEENPMAEDGMQDSGSAVRRTGSRVYYQLIKPTLF
jgi:hypothetical protein